MCSEVHVLALLLLATEKMAIAPRVSVPPWPAGAIARCPQPKAVICGNHEAWFSLTAHGRQRRARVAQQSASLSFISSVVDGSGQQRQQQQRRSGSQRNDSARGVTGGGLAEAQASGSAAAAAEEDGVGRQLALLGWDHVGYGSKQFEGLGLCIVGEAGGRAAAPKKQQTAHTLTVGAAWPTTSHCHSQSRGPAPLTTCPAPRDRRPPLFQGRLELVRRGGVLPAAIRRRLAPRLGLLHRRRAAAHPRGRLHGALHGVSTPTRPSTCPSGVSVHVQLAFPPAGT